MNGACGACPWAVRGGDWLVSVRGRGAWVCGGWLLRTRENSGQDLSLRAARPMPMAAPPRPVPPQPAPRRRAPAAPLGRDTSDVLQQIMAITDQSLDEAQARCGAQAGR